MDPGYLIARRATHYNPGGLKLAKMRGPTEPGHIRCGGQATRHVELGNRLE